MVKALYGKCGGRDIRFSLDEASGRWVTAVPASPTGAYIIELWAEDEAGNVGYFATVQITFDPSRLCCSVKVLDVGARFTVLEVRQLLGGDGVSCSVFREPVTMALLPDLVLAKVIKCEVCGQ